MAAPIFYQCLTTLFLESELRPLARSPFVGKPSPERHFVGSSFLRLSLFRGTLDIQLPPVRNRAGFWLKNVSSPGASYLSECRLHYLFIRQLWITFPKMVHPMSISYYCGDYKSLELPVLALS